MKLNDLIIGDTQYTLTKAYREGAMAMRERIPFTCNPYANRDAQTHVDWEYGHDNEAAGEHIRFGQDLLQATQNGRSFEEDPAVPHDEHGNVDSKWYHTTLQSLCVAH